MNFIRLLRLLNLTSCFIIRSQINPKKKTTKYIRLPFIYFLITSSDEKITKDDSNDVRNIFNNVRSTLFFFFLLLSFSLNATLMIDANSDREKNMIRRTGSLLIKFSMSSDTFRINV